MSRRCLSAAVLETLQEPPGSAGRGDRAGGADGGQKRGGEPAAAPGSEPGPASAPGAWLSAVGNRPDEQGSCWDCGTRDGAQARAMAPSPGLPATLTVVLCDGCALRLEGEAGDRLLEDSRRAAGGREDCAPVAAVEDEASRAVTALALPGDTERIARIVARQRLGARILTALAFWREKRF